MISVLIKDILSTYRNFLILTFDFVIQNSNENYSEFRGDFQQSNWEFIVEYKLSYFMEKNIRLQVYGDGADMENGASRVTQQSKDQNYMLLCNPKKNEPDIFNNIFPDNMLIFDRFVTMKDNWYFEKPPFNYVLCNNSSGQVLIYGVEDIEWNLNEIPETYKNSKS